MQNDTMVTSDFNLAAYLLANGYIIEELNRTDQKRIKFIFKHIPQSTIDKYWGNSYISYIGVQNLIIAQKTLKNRLFYQ